MLCQHTPFLFGTCIRTKAKVDENVHWRSRLGETAIVRSRKICKNLSRYRILRSSLKKKTQTNKQTNKQKIHKMPTKPKTNIKDKKQNKTKQNKKHLT